jgi:hypothetical protein
LQEELLLLQRIAIEQGMRKFHDIGENALTAVDWAVPCLLRLHKRIIEKMTSMLFIESLNEVESKVVKHRLWKAKQIQKILNKTVVDTPSNKVQYHLPMDNDGQPGEIKFNDSKAQQLMDRMHLILLDIVLNKDRLKIWRKCVTQFQTLYFKLRTHLDFTEDEVVLVQKQIDSFNACWLELAHKEGMTNYIHMLSAGHIDFYLRKWKNMYRYQNQGWEHLHLQITYVFHHLTQHGGHSGNTRGRSLKTWPLGM